MISPSGPPGSAAASRSAPIAVLAGASRSLSTRHGPTTWRKGVASIVGALATKWALASTWVKPWHVVVTREIRNWSPAAISPLICNSGFQRKCGSIGMLRSMTHHWPSAARRGVDLRRQLRAELLDEVLADLVRHDLAESLSIDALHYLHALRFELSKAGGFAVLVHLPLQSSRFLARLDQYHLQLRRQRVELRLVHDKRPRRE